MAEVRTYGLTDTQHKWVGSAMTWAFITGVLLSGLAFSDRYVLIRIVFALPALAFIRVNNGRFFSSLEACSNPYQYSHLYKKECGYLRGLEFACGLLGVVITGAYYLFHYTGIGAITLLLFGSVATISAIGYCMNQLGSRVHLRALGVVK